MAAAYILYGCIFESSEIVEATRVVSSNARALLHFIVSKLLVGNMPPCKIYVA